MELDPVAFTIDLESFLIEPGVYDYTHTIWSRDGGPPDPQPGKHAIDVITTRSLNALDEAHQAGKPFFLGVAPAVPHVGITATTGHTYLPIPQDKWKDAFSEKEVPRDAKNWNPDTVREPTCFFTLY